MATLSPPWAYTLDLPRDARAPGVARATLRTVLAVHGLARLTPTAELLVSELLTNAHRHTSGPYALRIRSVGPGRLRVAVWDSDSRLPPGFGGGGGGAPASVPAEDAEGGRGLQIVRACADTWGGYALGDGHGGKLLWAECGSATVSSLFRPSDPPAPSTVRSPALVPPHC
ncbi:anti-sigma regulatory factor (Ser/Thr protein kinase) [Streptomyces sp. V4I2]|nr:anti-sigma regulatory factor (Ser/Thr protein kinase) [Streptomyces sp. V4I2]